MRNPAKRHLRKTTTRQSSATQSACVEHGVRERRGHPYQRAPRFLFFVLSNRLSHQVEATDKGRLTLKSGSSTAPSSLRCAIPRRGTCEKLQRVSQARHKARALSMASARGADILTSAPHKHSVHRPPFYCHGFRTFIVTVCLYVGKRCHD